MGIGDARLPVRVVVAIVAEVVYLVGRTTFIMPVEDALHREIAWTAWRLVFVVFYFWLFRDVVRNRQERRPLPRSFLLTAAIFASLATMPFGASPHLLGWNALFDLVAIPVLAMREEIFFRAILQGALERVLHPISAALVATAAFAASHIGTQPINLVSISSFVAGGIVLGVVYQHTRNLWIVIALHAAADFLVYLSVFTSFGPAIAVIGDLTAIFLALLWWSNAQEERRMGL